MSFERPTLAALVSRIEADLTGRLSLVSAPLRRAVLVVLPRVLAGAAHMLHGHLSWLSRQLFPDQSDEPFLIRQAGMFGVTKTPPTHAAASVTITGVDSTALPVSSRLVRSLDGAVYTTESDATIVGGSAGVAVNAVDSGSAASLRVGQTLTLESPVSGINSTVTVTSILWDGNDLESTESLRARFLARLARTPTGGRREDYIAWAKSISGVTRVWVVPDGRGPGTVLVYFARDNDPDPIPDAGEIAAVQAKLDTESPAHAEVTAVAPTQVTQAVTVSITPNTPSTQAAVRAELADLVFREGEPSQTVPLASWRTAIGSATGVTNYTLTVPAADVTLAQGELLKLGTVTFV